MALIVVDYDVQLPVTDATAALECGAPRVHEDTSDDRAPATANRATLRSGAATWCGTCRCVAAIRR